MSQRRRILLGLLLGGLALILWLIVAIQPVVADHFGYAVAMPAHLPARVIFDNAPYDLLQNHPTQANLESQHLWPLQRVGSLWTLFGPSRPILIAKIEADMLKPGDIPLGLYVPDGTTYLLYERGGGP